jgi:shikimate kinase
MQGSGSSTSAGPLSADLSIVTLIGYRGTGKTRVAGPLAERLAFDAIDADAEIERRTQKTIREIFANEGEPAFRKYERTVMADLLARRRLVIASGGGAVLDPATRDAMRSAGPVVWLRASIAAIISRLAGDETTAERRPNLTPFGGAEEIEKTLAVREPIYRQCATLVVDTDTATIDEIVEQIRDRLPASLREGAAS